MIPVGPSASSGDVNAAAPPPTPTPTPTTPTLNNLVNESSSKNSEDAKFGAAEQLSKHYRNCLWWSRRTLFERSLVAITVALFFICIILVLVNVLLEAKLRKAQEKDILCTSKECITSAASLLSKIDLSVDPCNDFYQFSCGTYLQKNTVPDDHFHRSLMQTMQDDIYSTLKRLLEEPVETVDSEAIIKAKSFYSSCMNTSSVEDASVSILMAFLSENEITQWPVLHKNWNKTKEVNFEWILSMLHVYEVDPFFHTFVAPDDRNTSVYLLHLYAGSPVLNTQYYPVNSSGEGEYGPYLMAYRELILETLRLLGADQEIAYRDVAEMLNFETDFANLTQASYENNMNSSDNSSSNSSSSGNSDEEYQFNHMNISQLEEIVPELRWGVLMKHVFDQVGIPYVDVNLNVVVHCEVYLQHLMALIGNTSARTVTNYLAWRFVIKYMPYLDIHFRRLYYDFRRQVPNTSEERTFFSRWKECVNVVNDGFGMALAAIYVRKQYDREAEVEVKRMVSSLKDSFKTILPHQTWLDGSTQTLCQEKVEAMGEKIGHPQYILDPEQLSKDYSELDISDEHFLNNILGMNRYEVYKDILKISRPVDKERDWFVEPLVVNAFYEATGNTVIFPVGILRSPVFHPDRPKFLNYGTLGVIIGHEITHGFDTNGRRFDKVGNMTTWWPEEISERFKEVTTCFSDQYSQYPIEHVGQNVDGNFTLDENICDNAGLQQSFMAYQKYVQEHGEEPSLPGVDFSNEQVFFLRYAQIWCEVISREGHERYLKDNHSPGKYRANGALINSPQFASTFNCPKDSPMNPAKKCRLWG